MSDVETSAERRARMLQALAEGALSLAMNLQARAMATDDDELAAELAGAFHKVSRSVRQSLALEAQFERNAVQAQREDAAIQRKENLARTFARSKKLRSALQELTWRETEKLDEEDAEAFDDLLYEIVERETLADDFLAEDFNDQVVRLLSALGYEVTPDGHVRRKGQTTPEPAFEDSA